MICGLPPETPAPPIFTSPIAPGHIYVDKLRIGYAVGEPGQGVTRVHIINVFPLGDERAELRFALPDGRTQTLDARETRDVIDSAVYRRIAAAVRKVDESIVVVPERIADWALGLTNEQIAERNAEAQAAVEQIAAQASDPNVIDLEERRIARMQRGVAARPEDPAPHTG